MNQSLLVLDGVSKRYGGQPVIDGLGFEVGAGEALGIIGPNGAGKTTLFNIIAGDVRPDAGRVSFAGRDITGWSPARLCRAGIGRSYQIPHPFAGMTVFENVLVGATCGAGLAESAGHAVAIRCLQRTGLLRQANTLAGSLPLLDRKRLELARALATGPKLLLLDEIAGGLTEHEVRELIGIVKDIRSEGVTLIWIEHIVHALMAVVDRLLAVSVGRLLTQGRPADVMASPQVREVYMGVEAG
ncbi:MAG: ABC transporter ATP-binding protein [Burkholderiales bacterium]|nr:ABC transporter ATP-binding protein [Burkholderiales bacterium]